MTVGGAIPRAAEADPLCALGIADLAARFRALTLSPLDVLHSLLDRVDRLNPRLRAYITVLHESAVVAARRAQAEMRAGLYRGPLHGVPVSLKDVIRARQTRTTAGSKMLADARYDDEDAAVVASLRQAGAVIVGKTNLDPFGVALADPGDPFGPVDHPRRPGHQTGGSSSGSAAAVAAGLCVASLGTDAGGSVRHPASVCGVVGFKPTHDLLPLDGVISSSPECDHVGVLARSVYDVAAVVDCIAVPGAAAERRPQCLDDLQRGVGGLRLAVPTDGWAQWGGRDVAGILERTRRVLAELGVVCVAVTLPESAQANEVARVLLGADHYAYHRRALCEGAPYSHDMRVRAREWKAITTDDRARAAAARTRIREEWSEVFGRADLVLLPANLAQPPRHGDESIHVDGKALPVQLVNSRFNRVSNLTGGPAIVVPAGTTARGFPVGVQLIGPLSGDALVLRAGHLLERGLGNLVAAWGIEPTPA